MAKEAYVCPEESAFYAQCLHMLLIGHGRTTSIIHGVGSGGGMPMIEAVFHACLQGVIHGYEINDVSWSLANNQIEHRYIVHNASIFNFCNKPYSCTLVHQPTISSGLEGLYGGIDGSMISRRL